MLVLLDYEKAYDKVWRDALIYKMLKIGVSATLIRWIQCWLSNRMAWVEFNSTASKKKLFRQGLPQGSVLSPILFLIYINDVAEVVDKTNASISLFADDIALWARDKSIDEASCKVELAAEKVAQWSEEWLMSLSIGKCEVALFNNGLGGTELVSVSMKGKELKINSNPTFLGVTYDRKLTFVEHVRKTTEKARKQLRIMRAVKGNDWGFDKKQLRTTYLALIRSILEYAAPAWAPWVSDTAIQNLERIQNEAGRIITGAVVSTPIDCIREESKLIPLKNRFTALHATAMEKSKHLSEENPRRTVSEAQGYTRLNRKDWRTTANIKRREAMGPDENILPFPGPTKPWGRRVELVFEMKGERKATAGENLALALGKTADNSSYEWIIYRRVSGGR